MSPPRGKRGGLIAIVHCPIMLQMYPMMGQHAGMRLNPPRDLSSIAQIIDALPPEEREDTVENIHGTDLTAIEGAVSMALGEAIRHTYGQEQADAWRDTTHPPRFTLRDLWLRAKRKGVEDQLLEQGFELPKETPATFHGRLERLRELHAEELRLKAEKADLAEDLATSEVDGAVAYVADAIAISRTEAYRRWPAKKT